MDLTEEDSLQSPLAVPAALTQDTQPGRGFPTGSRSCSLNSAPVPEPVSANLAPWIVIKTTLQVQN